jgi:hypothetical protein
MPYTAKRRGPEALSERPHPEIMSLVFFLGLIASTFLF